MSVNLTPPGIICTIDGVDFSAGFEEWLFSTNPLDGGGLKSTTGTVTLQQVLGLESLNSRTNGRFAIGNAVVIQTKIGAGSYAVHPRGRLRILKATPNLRDGSLVLEVGDLIALLSSRQPTDPDDTEIEAGTGRPYHEIINSLLTAAGITSGITGPLSTPTREINYPINPGNSYLETVGLLLYVEGYVGYVDNAEVFRAVPNTLNQTTVLAATVGEDEAEYGWATNPVTPREVVKAVGIATAVVPVAPTTIDVEVINGDPAEAGGAGAGTVTLYKNTETISWANVSKVLTKNYRAEQAQGLVFADLPGTALMDSADQTFTVTYSQDRDGRVLTEAELTEYPFGNLFGEYVKDRELENNTGLRKGLETAIDSTTTHTYDANKNLIKRVVEVKEPVGVLISGINYPWADHPGLTTTGTTVSNIKTLVTSYKLEERWTQKSAKGWKYEKLERKPVCRARNPLDLPVFDDFATPSQFLDALLLLETIRSDAPVQSDQGFTNPPTVDRPPVASQEEERLEATVTLSQFANPFVEREQVFEVDYLAGTEKAQFIDSPVWTDPQAQLTACAQHESLLLLGRYNGAVIELPVTQQLLDNWVPLLGIAVTEPGGTVYQYKIDGENWLHQADQAYVSFDLILTGIDGDPAFS